MLLRKRRTLAVSASAALALFVGLMPSSASATSLFQGQERYLDFEQDASGNSLSAGNGETIDNEWADWGVNLSADSYRNGADDMLLLYDSSRRGEDNDLRTGHRNSSPSENNLLIIHEDKSGNSIYRPDDEANGGAITFDFSAPLTVGNAAYNSTYQGVDLGTIRLVDIDDNPTLSGVSFKAFSGNQLLFSKTAQQLNDDGLASQIFAGVNRHGDNSVWDFNLGSFQRASDTNALESAVTRLVVDYSGSGAIAGLGWHQLHDTLAEPPQEVPEPTSMLGLAALGLCATGSKLKKRLSRNPQ
ncbi:MAG: PEP-CTERM sorting domain-containing protein [Cyanobacteria bacterium P01_E01_bin.6]